VDGARDPAGWKHLQRFLRLWAGRAISANRPGFYEAQARALAGTGEGMLLNDALTHRLACRERDVPAVCRRMRLGWAKQRLTGELLMTAPHARQPQILPRPACTPTAIRAVLAANAGGEILQRYDEDLDAAFEQAREQGDVTPLVQTVKRWWFEADAWRDPQAQREYLARIDTYRDEGPPSAEQRMGREEIRAQFGV
jgi:hypothetical protein